MSTSHYNVTYATGGLMIRQSLIVAECYSDMGEWAVVKEAVMAGNLLQVRTTNAAKRVYHEISARLMQLNAAQMELLLQGSRQEQGYLLWLAVCKRSVFLRDFAEEVLREKFLRFDFALTADDFDAFFRNKAEWHPELAAVAESTYKQQRLYLFKTLRDAELLSDDYQIVPAMLSPHLVAVIVQDSPAYLAIYPTTDVA